MNTNEGQSQRGIYNGQSDRQQPGDQAHFSECLPINSSNQIQI